MDSEGHSATRPVRVAVVTGGAGDIGRAIARALLGDGCAVLLVDIDRAALGAAAEALAPQRAVATMQADVTRPAELAQLLPAAEALGAPAVLVNNAGRANPASLAATDAESWQADIALNLSAAFHCFKALEPALKANAGAVVNIGSVNGLGAFGHPAYSAAKAGLIHLTRLIAVEYGKFGIRANSVAPGTVRTRAWAARVAANPDLFEELRSWYPLGRVTEPGDVAEAVRFLASAGAAAITGICLTVDCGLTAGQARVAGAFSQSPDY